MVSSQKLIKSGYFPKELPPPFNTDKLAGVLNHLTLEDLEKIIKEWQKLDREHNIPGNKCCLFSIPRTRKVRRIVSIPHPLYQIILCYYLERNWNEIEQLLSKSTISLSVPCIPITNQKSHRSFDIRSNYQSSEQEISICSAKYRVLLKTDIARFYNTIYTHSIPWALHGKETAKANRQDLSLCGNIIDKCVQRTKEGQTLGIPIGPDTSALIAEIICIAMEIELEKILNKKVVGVRFIDDISLFFNERSEAELVLTKLQEALRIFELEINPAKTKIEELPFPLVPEWKSTIRQFKFRDYSKFQNGKIVQKSDLFDYFSMVFEYYNKFSDQNILLYALKTIQDYVILKENWSLMESFILKCILFEGSCIPTAINIFLDYDSDQYPLNMVQIKEVILELINYHTKYSNDYEISWALWLQYALGIGIPEDLTAQFQNTDNPIVQLMVLDLSNKGKINVNIASLQWDKYLDKKYLYDEHWLFAYEVNKKGWLSNGKSDFVEEDPFFKILKNNSVEFYDDHISFYGWYVTEQDTISY